MRKEKVSYLNQMRGIMAFCIMIAHLWSYTGIIFLLPFNKFVTIAVAYFFFISGYSLMESYRDDKRYLNKICYIKLPYLIYLAIVAYLVGVVLEFIMYGNKIGKYLPISCFRFLLTTNWYIYELIGFYCLFFVCMKCLDEKTGIIALGITTIIGFFLLFFIDKWGGSIGEPYYDSIIGFWLGAFLNYIDIGRKDINRKTDALLSVLLITIGMIFLIYVKDHTSIWFAIIRNLSAVGVLVLIDSWYWMIPKDNGVVQYVSKISAEIYIIHIPVCLLFRLRLEQDSLFILFAFVITLLLAAIFHPINQMVKRKLQKLLYS